MRRFLGAALLSGLVVGCATPVDPNVVGTTGNGTLIDTNFCDVQALGTLETGEMIAGSTEWVEGQDIEGSWIFKTLPMVDPNCVPDDDADAGCHFNGGQGQGPEGHADQDHDQGHHTGWLIGVGHTEHGQGHGWGHANHDHDGEDPCAPHSDLIVLTPDNLRCRVNGVTLGDVDGTATVNGQDGYIFHLAGQEFADPTPDYVTVRIWEPNPAYVPGGTEPEYTLFYEASAQFATGSFDVTLP